MRLCFVADSVSVHTQRWVSWFAKRDHEVHLISRQFDGQAENFDKRVQIHSLARLCPCYQASKISTLAGAAVWVWQVRRLVRAIRPDVLHGHSIGVPGYLAAASGFHPLVLGAWGSDILIDAKYNAFLRMLTRRALMRADRITSVSFALKEEIAALTGTSDRIEVVRMGIDLESFCAASRDDTLLPELGFASGPVVISTRWLKPIYDVETLIRAVPAVLQNRPDAKFIIAGEGNLRASLENLASHLGVSNNVRFTGFIAPRELPRYLASSDVYVSTSLSDSLAISTLEAMACGVPVVVGNLPVTREWIVDGESGYLFPLRDHRALAQKILAIVGDDSLRKKFSEAGRRMVAEKADLEKEMPKMERIYHELQHIR